MFRTDADLLRWVRAKVMEFTDMLRRTCASDPRAIALIRKLKAVRLLPPCETRPANGSWKNGKFKHSTGVMYVAPRTPDGKLRKPSSLLKTVVHELAHATRDKHAGEDSHSQQWKQTWLWFLSLATEHLGWVVDIKCAECTYYGLCSKQQCPKCNWLQNLCRPYTGIS